ncbi:MAG: LamG domain-containing protein, partial [Planctomycetota bacterium]
MVAAKGLKGRDVNRLLSRILATFAIVSLAGWGPAAAFELPADTVLYLTLDKSSLVASGGATMARSAVTGGASARVFGTKSTKGVAGQALRFRSLEDYLSIGTPAGISPAEGLTVSAWVRIEKLADANYIVSNESWAGSLRGFVLRISDTGEPDFTVGNGGWVTCKGPVIKAKKWYHLLGTFDRRETQLFVNGALVEKRSVARIPHFSRYGVTVGRGNFDQKRGFDGSIDEVLVLPRRLSAKEVTSLYRRGKSGQSLVPATKQPKNSPLAVPFPANAKFREFRVPKLFRSKGKVLGVAGSGHEYALFTSGRAGLRLERAFLPSAEMKVLNFEELDAAADDRGFVHVATSLVHPKSRVRSAYYRRLDETGEPLQPWISVNQGLEANNVYSAPIVSVMGDSVQ